MIQKLLNDALKRYPFRELVTIPAGDYVIDEPIVIELPVLPDKPNEHARGKGLTIHAHGVTLIPSAEFKGDCVIQIIGTRPVIYGLNIFNYQKLIPIGVHCSTKVVGGKHYISGGCSSWYDLTVEGMFGAAVQCDNFEEFTFYSPNISSKGDGFILRNTGHSMTCLNIENASIYCQGIGIAAYGDVQDCSVSGYISTALGGLVAPNTGARNKYRLRVEGVQGGYAVSKSQSSGWSGTSKFLVNPDIQG